MSSQVNVTISNASVPDIDALHEIETLSFSSAQAATPQDKAADSTATVLLFNAMKEYNSGNYSQANVMFQQLAAIEPDNDAAYYYLANIAIKTGDAPSGELYLKKGIELDSANFWYREMLLPPIFIMKIKPDKSLFTGGFLCGLCLAGGEIIQQYGLLYTSAGKAGFLTALYVIMIPVIGIFIKRRSDLKIWCASVLSVTGAYSHDLSHKRGLLAQL